MDEATLTALRQDNVTANIVDAALRIHRDLGPGLLESVYESILARELTERGFEVERQKLADFNYRGQLYREGFRVDLIVDRWVVIELKSIEKITPVHSKQLLTYLKLLGLPVGLLINFGGATLREGLKRIVNTPRPQAVRLPVAVGRETRHVVVPGRTVEPPAT